MLVIFVFSCEISLTRQVARWSIDFRWALSIVHSVVMSARAEGVGQAADLGLEASSADDSLGIVEVQGSVWISAIASSTFAVPCLATGENVLHGDHWLLLSQRGDTNPVGDDFGCSVSPARG